MVGRLLLGLSKTAAWVSHHRLVAVATGEPAGCADIPEEASISEWLGRQSNTHIRFSQLRASTPGHLGPWSRLRPHLRARRPFLLFPLCWPIREGPAD